MIRRGVITRSFINRYVRVEYTVGDSPPSSATDSNHGSSLSVLYWCGALESPIHPRVYPDVR